MFLSLFLLSSMLVCHENDSEKNKNKERPTKGFDEILQQLKKHKKTVGELTINQVTRLQKNTKKKIRTLTKQLKKSNNKLIKEGNDDLINENQNLIDERETLTNHCNNANVATILSLGSELAYHVAQEYYDEDDLTYSLSHDWNNTTSSNSTHKFLLSMLDDSKYDKYTGNDLHFFDPKDASAYTNPIAESLAYNANNLLIRRLGKMDIVKSAVNKCGYNNLPEWAKVLVREGVLLTASHGMLLGEKHIIISFK